MTTFVTDHLNSCVVILPQEVRRLLADFSDDISEKQPQLLRSDATDKTSNTILTNIYSWWVCHQHINIVTNFESANTILANILTRWRNNRKFFSAGIRKRRNREIQCYSNLPWWYRKIYKKTIINVMMIGYNLFDLNP